MASKYYFDRHNSPQYILFSMKLMIYFIFIIIMEINQFDHIWYNYLIFYSKFNIQMSILDRFNFKDNIHHSKNFNNFYLVKICHYNMKCSY
jgi:hypothetical protein